MDRGLVFSAMPLKMVRLEALLVCGLGGLVFWQSGWSWWWFAGLFFVPDLAMAGYLLGAAGGALFYNLAHTYLAPAALVGAGVVLGFDWTLPAGAIWTAHIGFDRVLGYGLKYNSSFHDTHLGRIGRSG